MKKIDFSKDEKAEIIKRVQRYFDTELDQPIGTLPAEFLLEFLTGEIGNFFYNRGLADARQALALKVDDLNDAIYLLERPVPERR